MVNPLTEAKTTTNEVNFFTLGILLYGKYIGNAKFTIFRFHFLGLHKIWMCLLVWKNLFIGYN